jgi:hypothetical protein
MNSHGIFPERSHSAVLDRPSTVDELVPHLVCNWPRVVINGVTVSAPITRSGTVVTARIHLGALLPSDVRVAVVMRPGLLRAAAEIPLSCHGEAREDGSFLFEGIVPPAALTDGRSAIRVTSAAALPAWRYILEAIEAPCRP